MATLNQQFIINGIVDTANTVLENIEQLALSSGCWVTFDVHTGRWSVIINQPGSPTKSFDDSNILGGVELSSTGLTELYNSVKVTYPRGDINGASDTVEARIADNQRYNNEPDNVLEIVLPLVTDPVQALLIGSRELKQGRVDRVAKFTTDYTALDLNAGDLISITLSSMGWTNKVFRVITTREADAEPGEIAIEVTALEYSADVYNNDLIKLDRSVVNNLVTIGDIGTPAAPVINIIDADTRPRLELVATTPPGLVAGIEFWLSRTNTTSDFVLVGTERPPAGGVYAAGTSVSLDVDNVNAGNVFARVRAVNSKTSSPYSPTSSGTFAPVQITQAVDSNTAIRGTGGISPTTLGLLSLLTGVDQAFLGNTAAGSLSRAIGNGLSSDGNLISSITANGVPVSGAVTFVGSDGLEVTGNTATRTITLGVANGDALVTGINVGNATPGGNSTTVGGNVTFVSTGPSVANLSVPLVNGDSRVFSTGNASTGNIEIYSRPSRNTQQSVLFADVEVSSGPWPPGSPLVLNLGPAANLVTPGYGSLTILVEMNGGLVSGAAGTVDPFKRLQAEVFVGNTMIANLETSSTKQDVYDDLSLQYNTVSSFYAPNQQVSVRVEIQTIATTAVKVSAIVFQTFGVAP